MSIKRIYFNVSCFVASVAVLAMPSLTNAQVTFNFVDVDGNPSEFSNGATIGAATTLSDADGTAVTVSLVDIFAPEFDAAGALTGNTLSAEAGDPVTTQVDSDDLGVDNPSVDDITFGSGWKTETSTTEKAW